MDWPVEENCPCPCTVETMYENISQNFLIKNCAKKVEVAKKNSGHVDSSWTFNKARLLIIKVCTLINSWNKLKIYMKYKKISNIFTISSVPNADYKKL